jgi:hypothetical protein
MADREFIESDAVRVIDAFEAFRTATMRQLQSADLGTIQKAARRKRRWRGYRVAALATLLLLLPSGIGLSLAEAGSHRASPAPSATAAPSVTPTASPAPSLSPKPTAVPPYVFACGGTPLTVALVAGDAASGTWRALIGFTNTSTQACTIGGYPTVVALDQAGATVTGQASSTGALVSSSYPAQASFTLAPGDQAGAEISGTQVDAHGQTCPAYQWLRVNSPGGYFDMEISSFIPNGVQYAAVCGGFSVSPLYPRAAFQYPAQAIISPAAPESPGTAACQASHLSARQTYETSVAQQPLTIIAFYNASTTACYLDGYVSIDAAAAGNQAVPVSVTQSGNYERSDPGPTHVYLPPGGAASFAIGSGLSFDGGAHIATLTTLTLTAPGSNGQLPVPTTIGVSRPNNTGPYPLSETALVAGNNGPNGY